MCDSVTVFLPLGLSCSILYSVSLLLTWDLSDVFVLGGFTRDLLIWKLGVLVACFLVKTFLYLYEGSFPSSRVSLISS